MRNMYCLDCELEMKEMGSYYMNERNSFLLRYECTKCHKEVGILP